MTIDRSEEPRRQGKSDLFCGGGSRYKRFPTVSDRGGPARGCHAAHRAGVCPGGVFAFLAFRYATRGPLWRNRGLLLAGIYSIAETRPTAFLIDVVGPM